MKNSKTIILILALALLTFAIRRCKHERARDHETKTANSKKESETVNRDRGFDRRTSYLEFSNHAKCRMDCRHINQSEVEEIMQDGKINYNKSDLQNARCPRYALEGITSDNQRVRIVFAQCNDKTEVVTVIDLETDWPCYCPGDDRKFENKN
jgi:hypothetical protein